MRKRFLLLLLITYLALPVCAESLTKESYKIDGSVQYDDNAIETIYLDDSVDKPRVNIPQRSLTLPVGVINITTNTNTSRSALARAMVSRNSLGDILPLSGSVSEKIGGFSYGSTWGEELSYSQLESTTSLFMRYDAKKYLSFETSLRQSANRDLDNQYGTMRLTPELHITDKLTLKDSFTNYVSGQKNKNEVVLVYRPSLKKYAEALKFELGVAQSYYSGGRQSSAFRFSTGFKI